LGTDRAVVGLSLSLRGEGATHGVRVSVVCPGGVDTPMLDKRTPADLPPVPSADRIDSRALITKMSGGGRLYDPDTLAADILRGIDRNPAIIVAHRRARILWRLMRLARRCSCACPRPWPAAPHRPARFLPSGSLMPEHPAGVGDPRDSRSAAWTHGVGDDNRVAGWI
jgi:hypothetical protein